MTVQIMTTGDGCKLAYRWDGPEGAPIVILSNSLGTDLTMWDELVANLQGEFRFLRYDTRGHGGSDAPGGSYGLDRLGRDVLELMDALNVDRVHFCGLSLGGMIAQWLGIRAESRLTSLAIVNSSAFMGPASGWDARIDLVREKGMVSITDAILERWFTAPFLAENGAAVQAAKRILLATNPHGYAGCCAAVRDMDMHPILSLIKSPTMIVAGERDPATPKSHSEELAAKIPGARLRSLPSAHLSSMELPDMLSDILLNWFKSRH